MRAGHISRPLSAWPPKKPLESFWFGCGLCNSFDNFCTLGLGFPAEKPVQCDGKGVADDANDVDDDASPLVMEVDHHANVVVDQIP